MKKILMALGLILVGSTVVWAASDGVYSLRGDKALEAPSVPTAAITWQDGEGKINRNYAQQPPMIPHTTEDFTIDQDGNSCLDCHNWKSEVPGATKVGVSHFLNRKNQALSNISPRRYFCNQCHVPQINAKPLVSNTFQPLEDE
jgi:cytochrome c-type protein NapB